MFYEGVVRQLSRKFACRGDDQATLGASWSSDSTCLRLGLSWMRSRPRKKWKDRERTGRLGVRPNKARSRGANLRFLHFLHSAVVLLAQDGFDRNFETLAGFHEAHVQTHCLQKSSPRQRN